MNEPKPKPTPVRKPARAREIAGRYPARGRRAESSDTPGAAPQDTRETILLVEDEPAVRQLFAQALTRAGYRVYEARNGQEALKVFDQHGDSIDLLLTDMRMPFMGGAELAHQLRARRTTATPSRGPFGAVRVSLAHFGAGDASSGTARVAARCRVSRWGRG